MLELVGAQTLDDLSSKALPKALAMAHPFQLPGSSGPGLGEQEALKKLEKMMNKNKVFKSYIGTGYYNTKTPPVILRNLIENPLWYTPYTPYQSEISQGRMESLVNFQQMVMDMTGMGFANASLLDEATACAEAMTLCVRHSPKKCMNFFVADDLHPQNIEVVRSRAQPLGISVVVAPAEELPSLMAHTKFSGVLLSYPNTYGSIEDHTELIQQVHDQGGLVVMATDLLALCMIKPPGAFRADIAVGNSQRFGVPLGYGGPHAAFFAVKDSTLMRKVPGRVVGISKDAHGNPAYRLALQPREQHIKRERATSNICTAQALLANTAAMYAVYHGPHGLRKISERVHHLTCLLVEGLRRLGYKIQTKKFFDTVTVSCDASSIVKQAVASGINVRRYPADKNLVGISLDETTTEADVRDLWRVFDPDDQDWSFKSFEDGSPFTVESLASSTVVTIADTLFARPVDYLTHPVFNSHHKEHDLLRYMHKLASKDISLAISMIPLGSCTMKLNATSEMIPITWNTVNSVHPFVPSDQARGYQELFKDLESMLVEITGFDSISFQPNSGASGEYAGLMVIRKYYESIGQSNRNVCIIPDSAHGTNPASATLAGLRCVVVKAGSDGYIPFEEFKKKVMEHKDNIAAVMITYPSTFGVFEENIRDFTRLIHDVGGQVYLDGANMNALVGLSRLTELGADVCHLNLHKTFCIPHGGGGPGMGPIGVRSHLSPFLPSHPVVSCNPDDRALGALAAAPWSSASILPITWIYLRMMGANGLRRATQTAILNANYMKERLKSHYAIRYTSQTGYVAHEFILDFNPYRKSAGVEVEDVAKRLMDYNFHSPTMSWPVTGTLMVEPTESEGKMELDRLCDALISIGNEIRDIEDGKQPRENNVLKNAPHTMDVICSDKWDKPYDREQAAFPLPYVRENKFWPRVSRVDNVYGDLNINCSCPPVSSYQEKE